MSAKKTSEIMELLERCGVTQDGEVLLQYLHDTGELLFYPKDDALKNIIVIDLMHVVNLSKSFITVLEAKDLTPLLLKDWRELDSGVLKEDLLVHLWSEFRLSKKEFNFFLSLLQQFGLICERKVTKGESREFYVLSRLKPYKTTSCDEIDENKGISLYHDFDNYLPDDVFQRTVTKFIEEFQMDDDELKLSYDHVELNIDDKHYVILSVATIEQRRMFKTTIIRTESQGSSDEELEPAVCKKVLSFLKKELKIFCPSEAQGVEVKLNIRCDRRNKKHWHVVKDFNKNMLPCGRKKIDVTRYCRLFGDDVSMPCKGGPRPLGGPFTPHKPEEQPLRSLLTELSKRYRGLDCRWLRCLLFDLLPIEDLSNAGDSAIALFNKLETQGHISCSNVIILSEVAQLTNIRSAISLITEYKRANHCDGEGTVLTRYRKTLFCALRQVANDELPDLIHHYQLGPQRDTFRDVWDLVYYLEREKLLDDTPDKVEKFTGLLNATAKKEMLKLKVVKNVTDNRGSNNI